MAPAVRTLVFLVTEDWYFCSHRLQLARAARSSGLRVVVVTGVRQHGDRIRQAGLELIPFDFRRRSINPLLALAQVLALARIYREVAPDLAHHVALKPVLLGTAAALLAGVPRLVNAIAGLGFTFSSRSFRARLLRPVLVTLLRLCLRPRRVQVLVQNDADAAAVQQLGVDPARVSCIRGSGVDLERFRPLPPPAGPVVATMVSRMLRDKGVCELVEAARLLTDRGCGVRIRLVGPPDADNPGSVSREALARWHRCGIIEWVDGSDDVPAQWARSHIAVLPSYREGLPRSLLEAGACARPMVSTDVPGCRDVVLHERTGLLVPARDPVALADAIERLADSAVLRERLGAAAREHVRQCFDQTLVIAQQLALYRRLLSDPGAGA